MQIVVEITDREAYAVAGREGTDVQYLSADIIRKYIHEGLQQVTEPNLVFQGSEYFHIDDSVKELLDRLMYLQCRLDSPECVAYSGIKLPRIKALSETIAFIRQTKEALYSHNVPEWVIEKALDYARSYDYGKYDFERFYHQKPEGVI